MALVIAKEASAPVTVTVSITEARNNFSRLGAAVVESGESVTVFRNSKPWVVISPANQASEDGYADDVLGILERGKKELAQGRYISLDEFLSRYKDDLDD